MAVATTEAPPLVRRRGAGALGVLREVAHRPKGVVGLVIVGGLILLAFFPSVFAPASPYASRRFILIIPARNAATASGGGLGPSAGWLIDAISRSSRWRR